MLQRSCIRGDQSMAYDKTVEMLAGASRLLKRPKIAICDSDRANSTLFASLRPQAPRRNDLIRKGFRRTARAGTPLAIASASFPARLAFLRPRDRARSGRNWRNRCKPNHSPSGRFGIGRSAPQSGPRSGVWPQQPLAAYSAWPAAPRSAGLTGRRWGSPVHSGRAGSWPASRPEPSSAP